MKNASLSKQGLIYKYIENLSMMKKPSVEIKVALMSALLHVSSKEIMRNIEFSWKQLEKEYDNTNV
jgi:hypothetical protein